MGTENERIYNITLFLVQVIKIRKYVANFLFLTIELLLFEYKPPSVLFVFSSQYWHVYLYFYIYGSLLLRIFSRNCFFWWLWYLEMGYNRCLIMLLLVEMYLRIGSLCRCLKCFCRILMPTIDSSATLYAWFKF